MSLIEIEEKLEVPQGAEILNAVIRDADILVAGHFGNAVMLRLELEDSENCVSCFRPMYNDTWSIGCIVKALFDTLEDPTDDSVPFSSLRGRPVRVLADSGSGRYRFIAVGHYMKNRWLTLRNIDKWLAENPAMNG